MKRKQKKNMVTKENAFNRLISRAKPRWGRRTEHRSRITETEAQRERKASRTQHPRLGGSHRTAERGEKK